VATGVLRLATDQKAGEGPVGARGGESVVVGDGVTTLQWAIAFTNKGKGIIAEPQDGTEPASIASFAELHGHVDANCYGGSRARSYGTSNHNSGIVSAEAMIAGLTPAAQQPDK